MKSEAIVPDVEPLGAKLQQLAALSPQHAEEIGVDLDYLLGELTAGRPQS